MNTKVRELAASFLDMAADRFGNDICTDWDFPDDWTHDERLAFVKGAHEWNGDPEEFDPDREPYINNFFAMGYVAHLIREIGEVTPSAP